MLYGDYHTHTTYSHGSGSIADNAAAATTRGVTEIAITDHGYSHVLFGLKANDIAAQHAAVAALRGDTKVLIGIEGNIVDRHGDIAMTPQQIGQLDILLVGFHHVVKTNLRDYFAIYLPNTIYKIFHIPVSKKVRELNTQAVISALKKYPIDIFTHMGAGAPVDVSQIAPVLAETSTFVELNNKRISFSAADVRALLDAGVQFVVSSDAHSPDRVGESDKALSFALKHRIPTARIINLHSPLPLKRKQ